MHWEAAVPLETGFQEGRVHQLPFGAMHTLLLQFIKTIGEVQHLPELEEFPNIV